jgi:hypothetical protein
MAGEGVDRSGDAAEVETTRSESRLSGSGIPFGAQLFGSTGRPSVNISSRGVSGRFDWRAKLTVGSGAKGLLTGPMGLLKGVGGIIFPNTPAIFIQHTTSYGGGGLTHTNYDHPAFDQHNIGEIQCTGTFTANTTDEADYMRASMHFLRTVSKMYFGQDSSPVAGTPPPVLRLNAYGDYVMKNVPVVLVAFTMEFQATVDYIPTTDGKSMMPTNAIITTTLKPAYSRASSSKEFGLSKFAKGDLMNKGFI